MYLGAQLADFQWNTHQMTIQLPKNSSVVLRDRCPLYIFIKSKLGNCGIKVWVAADVKSFCDYKMQLYIWAGLMEQERRSRASSSNDMVCYIYGTGRGVTTDIYKL